MSFVLEDRVKESCLTTGTDDVVLVQPFEGYQSFDDGVGDGNQTYYVIENQARWEVGIGTYTSSTKTVSRDTILASSSGGSKVSLTGPSTVFVSYPADKAIYFQPDGEANVTFTQLSDVNIPSPASGQHVMFNGSEFVASSGGRETKGVTGSVQTSDGSGGFLDGGLILTDGEFHADTFNFHSQQGILSVDEEGWLGVNTTTDEVRAGIHLSGTGHDNTKIKSTRYADWPVGPYLCLEKARGTKEAPEAAQSGDNLGGILFNYYTGSGWAGHVSAIQGYLSSATEGGLSFFAGETINNQPAKMWFDHKGQLGVNIATPDAKLQSNVDTATDIASIFKTTDDSLNNNITEWRDSSDNVLVSVDSYGIVKAANVKVYINVTKTENTIDYRYYGGLDPYGDWKIFRYDRADLNTVVAATESNNPTYTDLATAWSNRATLIYA